MKQRSKGHTVERISHTVMYSLTALVCLVFALFYCVGYGTVEGKYNVPVCTDLLIIFMMTLFVAAVCVVVVAKVLSLRKNHAPAVVNGVHARRVTWGVIALTTAVMLLSYIFAPSTPILVNRALFDDRFWLSLSNMFVFSSLLLLAIAVCCIIFGLVRTIIMRRK